MDLSVIIPSFNTNKLLAECLSTLFRSLRDVPFSFEVLVVDNASSDGSSLMVKEKFPQVRLIENDNNPGYGKANNQAVRQARGDYLLLLNSDAEVLNSAVEKLYRYTAENEFVDIAGGKLYNQDLTPQPSCGPFYTLPYVFGYLLLRGDHWGFSRYSPDYTKEVDWVSGACLLISKKNYTGLGGFDEAIFMYMDEVDLLYRAKQKGYRVFFYPEAEFIHHGAASSQGLAEPIQNVFRGLLYFYKKHRSLPELWLLKIILTSKTVFGLTVGFLFKQQRLIDSYKNGWEIIWEEK